jgi:hypothetical protein
MKKLLRKLFLYLFKEDFKRMKALERDLKGLIHRQKCATSLAEVRAERIRKLLGNIDVSQKFINVQAHGLSYPYRVGRRTTLNSLTSTKEVSGRFLLSYDSLTGRMLRLTPTPLIDKC